MQISKVLLVNDDAVSLLALEGLRTSATDSDGDELAASRMRNAGPGLYHARHRKRSGIAFFRAALNARETDREQWTCERLKALEGGEFAVQFQPRHRLVAAAEFLPDVLDRNLLERVDDWTIGAAWRQAAMWRDGTAALPQLPVKLASPGVSETLAARILGHVRSHKLARCVLKIDTSEDQLAGQRELETILRQLDAWGVSLAVDHFGSASPGLALLRSLPFSAARIERSFVRTSGLDGGADRLAALMHLARARLRRTPRRSAGRSAARRRHAGVLSQAAAHSEPPRRAQARPNLFTPKKRGHSR